MENLEGYLEEGSKVQKMHPLVYLTRGVRETQALINHIRKNKEKGIEKFPLQLMLDITYICNLNCKGCGRVNEYHNDADLMSLEEALGAAEESGAPIVYVAGGEPLLHPQVDEIVKGLMDMRRYVHLCTNGLYIGSPFDTHNILYSVKPATNFKIDFHVDGPEAVHDSLVNYEGAFKYVTRGIECANKWGFWVNSITTLYNKTKPDDLDSLFRDLAGRWIDAFFVSSAYKSAYNENDVFLNPNQTKELGGKLLELRKIYRIANSTAYFKFLNGELRIPCTPWATVIRNTHGWKSPCYAITEKYYKTLKEMMDNTDWDYYASRKDKRCLDCKQMYTHEPTVWLKAPGLPRST